MRKKDTDRENKIQSNIKILCKLEKRQREQEKRGKKIINRERKKQEVGNVMKIESERERENALCILTSKWPFAG